MKVATILALFLIVVALSASVIAKSKRRRGSTCGRLCASTFVAYRKSRKSIDEFDSICDKKYAEKAKDKNCSADLCDTIESLAKKTKDMSRKERVREVSRGCRAYSKKKMEEKKSKAEEKE
ncbi:hypothetical protein OESDEN_11163 [Oesophagostomum dentatum]|uniref:Uncharacterized protein n=1 Tax=Oesophagostomum dentatum TaxID=61180 RepID=A0A0B1SUN3_OESDE|nr:hypothetical protein OESDEN_11163 [Oesophagostomum dentatum]